MAIKLGHIKWHPETSNIPNLKSRTTGFSKNKPKSARGHSSNRSDSHWTTPRSCHQPERGEQTIDYLVTQFCQRLLNTKSNIYMDDNNGLFIFSVWGTQRKNLVIIRKVSLFIPAPPIFPNSDLLRPSSFDSLLFPNSLMLMISSIED
ncbi:hypothetical protein M8J75_002784 [Diaphorina citri]|nr:hypothetical protein M8J75_002784 [Diaphorina citri]